MAGGDKRTLRCLNCSLRVSRARIKRYAVSELSADLQNILQRWLELPQLPDDAVLCHECYWIVNESACDSNQGRRLGHTDVCVGCGSSVLRKRNHILEESSPLLNLYQSNTINLPGHITRVCDACVLRENRRKLKDELRESRKLKDELGESNDVEIKSEPTTNHEEGDTSEPTTYYEELDASEPPVEVTVIEQRILPLTSIVLPNYKRSPNTSRRCVFNDCCKPECKRVPRFIRVKLLKEHNFYIPQFARVCDTHLHSNTWESLPETCNTISDFTAEHMEDILDLAKIETHLDFENVHGMPNHICQYWTGLNVSEFLDLYNKLSLGNCVRSPKSSLAMFLVKLRTGDSSEKLAPVFGIPRRTLDNRIKKLAKFLSKHSILLQNYVPTLFVSPRRG